MNLVSTPSSSPAFLSNMIAEYFFTRLQHIQIPYISHIFVQSVKNIDKISFPHECIKLIRRHQSIQEHEKYQHSTYHQVQIFNYELSNNKHN